MRLFISTLLFFTVVTNYAQDIIVVNGNDTINCKITEVSAHQIHFKVLNNKKELDKSLPITQVKFYEFNKATITYTEKESVTAKKTSTYNKARFFINGGYTLRTAKIKSATTIKEKEHLDELKSGRSLEVGINYFPLKYIGFSFNTSWFNSINTSKEEYINMDGSSLESKNLKNNVSIYQVSISPNFRYKIGKKKNHTLLYEIGVGYEYYRNISTLFYESKFTGETFSFISSLGYDYKFSKKFAIGVKLNTSIGSIKKVILNDNTEIKFSNGNYETISRNSVLIGIRFIN
jgi:hypothetical protein